MNHFFDKADVAFRDRMLQTAPEEYRALIALMKATRRADGAIPPKYRELIAIAVAHATGCPYCIEAHVKEGKRLGMTKEEMSEAIMMSAALCAGAAAAHGGMAIKFFETEHQ